MSDDKAKSRAPAAAGRGSVAGASSGSSGSSRPAGAAVAKRDGEDADGEGKRPGAVRWVLGWIVLPGTVIGAIFGGGALVGAHFHDSWFTRAVVWVIDLF